jgi:hypothetical protein
MRKALLLPFMLCLVALALTFPSAAASSPPTHGMFQVTGCGVGAYGKGSKIGDAFVSLKLGGSFDATTDGKLSSLRIYVDDYQYGGNQLTIRYYTKGSSWHTYIYQFTGPAQVGYWYGLECSGTTTWTVKDSSGLVTFSIKWNSGFTSGKICGTIRGTVTIGGKPLTVVAMTISGTATPLPT